MKLRNNRFIISVMMALIMVFTLMPGTAFADDSDLGDYTGLQQGTTSTRVYMLNSGVLEDVYPAVFGDTGTLYDTSWNIRTKTSVTDYWDNYIQDTPDAGKEIKFVFSLGGSGMNKVNVKDDAFVKGVTDYVNITDSDGNQKQRSIELAEAKHPGSGGGSDGGSSRAVDVIVRVAPDELAPDQTYRLEITKGLSTGRTALDKDIYFTFKTAPVLVSAITLDRTEASVTEGESLKLTADVAPDNASDKTIIWSTSDLEIAAVEDGNVTALKPGKVTITATAADGSNVSASCEITVLKKAATPGTNDSDKDKDGRADGSEKEKTIHGDPSTPDTGDSSNITLYVILMALSAAGTVIVIRSRRQRNI